MSLRRIGQLTEGERFAIARRRARVRQAELGVEAGVRQNWVSAWERGRREFGQDKVDALWEALERVVRDSEQVAS